MRSTKMSSPAHPCLSHKLNNAQEAARKRLLFYLNWSSFLRPFSIFVRGTPGGPDIAVLEAVRLAKDFACVALPQRKAQNYKARGDLYKA